MSEEEKETTREITTVPVGEGLAIDLGAELTARVTESLVLHGDISGLSSAEKTEYYLRMCASLGLNPATNPLQLLKLNGKEILYPTRGATDQLAAIHRLNREIIEGPEIRAIGDAQIVYCKARVTHPNGRVETSMATLPCKDPTMDLMKCECVPLDTEILTRRGFKRHDELTIGEDVLAYDCATGTSEWVPLENVTTYPAVPVVSLRTNAGRFEFVCTPTHSWAMNTLGTRGRTLVEARAIKSQYRLIIAAPAIGGDHPLSPDLAAVIGWVMTDGTIRRIGNYVSLKITQSKPNRVSEIRSLLERAGLHATETVGQPTVRTFPGGGTYACLPQHTFNLRADESRSVLLAAGIEGPADMPRLVTRLSVHSRRAMLDAMMAGDGTANGHFGKKEKPGVMDAWQILCTLEGYALGKRGMSSAGEVPVQKMLTYDCVAGSNLELVPAEPEPVWCPTTRHGTWVARQRGRISITGNTKAKRRATLSILGLGMLDEMEIADIPASAKSAAAAVRVASAARTGDAELIARMETARYEEEAEELLREIRALGLPQTSPRRPPILEAYKAMMARVKGSRRDGTEDDRG